MTQDSDFVPLATVIKALLGNPDRRWLAVMLLLVSIAVLILMFAGGLVNYVPGSISAMEMQNIYLARIQWYGLLSCFLQIVAIALIITSNRSKYPCADAVQPGDTHFQPVARRDTQA